MSRGADHLALEAKVDLVPIGEGVLDGLIGRPIMAEKIVEGLVREDHAKSEGVVGSVALEDGDVRVGKGLFGQNGEVQTARTTADHDYLHCSGPLHRRAQ